MSKYTFYERENIVETYERYYGRDFSFLEWLADNWETLSFMALFAILCGFALFLYAIWCFIASAVKRGVEDALRYAPLQKTDRTTYASQTVKNGILEAMEELKIVEFKYYDESGREVHFKKNLDNDDFDSTK